MGGSIHRPSAELGVSIQRRLQPGTQSLTAMPNATSVHSFARTLCGVDCATWCIDRARAVTSGFRGKRLIPFSPSIRLCSALAVVMDTRIANRMLSRLK
jgi:hypothetical protein